MRESEKKKVQKNNQTKQFVRTPRRENKSVQDIGRRPSNAKESNPKASRAKPASNSVVSDTNVGTEPPEVYENVVIHYVDDAYRSGDAVQVPNGQEPAAAGDKSDDLEDSSSEFGKDIQPTKGDDSDYESLKGSTLSQDDDEKIDGAPTMTKNNLKSSSSDVSSHASKSNVGVKSFDSSPPRKPMNSNGSHVHATDSSDDKKSPLTNQELFDDASNDIKSTESDDDSVGAEENVDFEQEKAALKQKAEIMESKLEKLEDELRVVAALEISLYSVIPEHGSSAHKVHTPARRLSRLYIHACKHWSRNKRAAIAKNIVSGLILVGRTCGNDVARLMFWLSNAVVLREIISQAFGISSQTSPPTLSVPIVSKNSNRKQVNMINQMFEDWEETSTFTSSLGKVESWIFSRVVESVWWQALTPNMLSPVEELISQKSIGKLLGPSLGDQQQGTLSIELWKNAFQSAFERLCPVRAAGHECGCIPVLARTVMEQCVERLDVAMFNAILRESAHQIPTDPVSDPIVDSRVLPIPAGDFSFGSGAQLKNSVGNWSRWFSNHLGLELDTLPSDDPETNNDDHQTTRAKTKCFCLLNELSELLMLPKDMLMDESIRKEVCPSINLGVIKRVLCYFTPDEFCPDPVPGEVLEALNAESYVERRVAGDSSVSFPYAAPGVSYLPPSPSDVSEKVGEAAGKPHIKRNVSMVQKKGYMSDEELDDLDSPLESFIEQSSPCTLQNGNSSLKSKEQTGHGGNARYLLLREVWSS
ncbi:uncharacterized protein LOC130821858 isoform X1 [Amaranthus tricolor]|uniref:uncharacterized protein LOC130821858 isoform X1 n=2 Tax=Amaranthus tricolor TaxID=29722 RepID=UPI00258E734E|nr:uncharacterized protein LOC130821858 isoform X1 [Amaranthus tricolor]XP_057543602.1 uncharacterized protein LOC130821858 isoform X1 [Amaranthus tricolor]XP_057543603.1 uncharacterized protein LOC130821858 isoform X1 [Amaranthus tricolor]